MVYWNVQSKEIDLFIMRDPIIIGKPFKTGFFILLRIIEGQPLLEPLSGPVFGYFTCEKMVCLTKNMS
jgi:hypothetical protein